MDRLYDLARPLAGLPHASTWLPLAGLLLAAWLANWITRRILLKLVARVALASPLDWDDALMARGVLSRLAHVVPALIIGVGILGIPGLPEVAVSVVHNVALAYIYLTIALSIGNLFNALNDLYESRGDLARRRPVKGYLQVAKLVVFLVAGVLVVATLIDRSPLVLLTGLGAMTAVVLLVFKDTILSLVASIQLSSHDMLRVGDWIEMPGLQADGDVIDIALHTVKVQNWDKTITTIPTHRLISDSFKNWRGMSEAGGRRIKRALLVDQASVRFLSTEERDGLRRIALIDDYLDGKRRELEAYNAELAAGGKDPVNTRRVTNLGTFRAYVAAYLRAHPRVRGDMTLLVRQLDPGATGIPLEVYCFTATTAWGEYEDIQSDIFDHLLAVLPEFGLRLFQQPGGADVAAAVDALSPRKQPQPQPRTHEAPA
ncbi:mechanosensitive ion channel family protein [Lysobacter sp. A3-1-A15]|uniref:mechanosensitive ion channel family protein n=1 Tax=Novilysobacter viscosus TaxID=3098602 RepID=UPI002ED8260E